MVTGVLGEKSLITVCPNSHEDLYEDLYEDLHQDLHQDAPLLSVVKPSALRLVTEYVLAAPVSTEQPLVSPQSRHADHPEEGASSGSRFPPGEDEAALGEETAVRLNLCDFVASGRGGYRMTCEAEYVANGCPTVV